MLVKIIEDLPEKEQQELTEYMMAAEKEKVDFLTIEMVDRAIHSLRASDVISS